MLDLGVCPDSFTFVSVLSLCLELDDARIGKAVHSLACQVLGSDGFNSHLVIGLIDMYSKCRIMELADLVFRTIADGKDVKAWSSMVSGYARCRKIEEAWKLFEVMPNKDLVAWTALIGGCCQSGRYKEALNYFEEMEQAGLRPDVVTIVTVLSACAQLGALCTGNKVHHYVEGNGLLGRNSRINTAIVDIYCKCGCIQTALDVFHGVDDTLKTVDLFNAIIWDLLNMDLVRKQLQYSVRWNC
ncbi:pentatricopeptide repeat-containing protein At1g05750, chloroplastic-like [Typha angustifolia]|uniref:pentatricopeptide repeat-containing protein At1g05750, chloroplastic-like n=1 Tax=Typha angustifolia TaxID=59011 RepID=UPI003C2B67A7